MITVRNGYEYSGLSTDDPKPTDINENGAIFYEIDTGKEYRFDAENKTWYEYPPAPEDTTPDTTPDADQGTGT